MTNTFHVLRTLIKRSPVFFKTIIFGMVDIKKQSWFDCAEIFCVYSINVYSYRVNHSFAKKFLIIIFFKCKKHTKTGSEASFAIISSANLLITNTFRVFEV